MEHFASVHDGAVVVFPHSFHYYMKVCTGQGQGGVVDIATGRLYNKHEIEQWGYGTQCTVVAKNLREHFAKYLF